MEKDKLKEADATDWNDGYSNKVLLTQLLFASSTKKIHGKKSAMQKQKLSCYTGL